MQFRNLFTVLIATIFCNCLSAQTFKISGNVKNSKSNQPIVGALVEAINTADTNQKLGTVSNYDGNYTISGLKNGNYYLRSSYIGHSISRKNITVQNNDQSGINFSLVQTATELKDVKVQALQERGTQNGDTTAFNSSAFKTNKDATAEELLNKMPGVSSADGTLKVNGETVKQVLVDGKPFFGEDPNAAIKNLPSEIIDKIQIYDRASDQAQFTGFDDGNSSKTINLVTKRGRNAGVFGKVTAGYGVEEDNTDGRYIVGGNLNFFNGDRRISMVGLANNINQQNFSSDDLLGVSSSSSGGGRGNFGGGGRRGGGGGGSDASNFLVAQQGGVAQTQSAGINYSDSWSKKLKVSGSYFFNRSENNNSTTLSRAYILTSPDSTLNYNEQSTVHSININHRANLRAEWTIDSMNSIIINPRISYQNNESQSYTNGVTYLNNSLVQSASKNDKTSNSYGYNFSNSILYRHKFAKNGRTISVNFDQRINTKDGNGALYSQNKYDTATSILDQQNDNNTLGTTYSGSINYTEPISKKEQLQINYSPSINNNTTEKITYNNTSGATYTDLDSSLSNKFENTYTTHRGGIGYRYSDSIYSFNATLNGQYAILSGKQTYPLEYNVSRSFTNILPMVMFNYKISKTENLRIFYRTNTNAPSINQLQNLVDNSNPLILTTGNPDLKQEYAHSLNVRYGKTGSQKGNGLFLFANATYTNNYIGNSSTIVTDNNTIVNGISVNPGAQISRPINFENMWRGNAFLTYSLPVKSIKSNLNISTGLNINRTPSIINNYKNFANNYGLNGGFVIGSNINENVDFTFTYNGTYTIVRNSLQGQSNYNYYSQTTGLRFNWIFLKNFVFNTNVNHTLYAGLGQGYDNNYVLWNASLGYKFLKNKALQADIYAFDILKQNNSITRNITDTYIEDSRTNVLQRYLMLRLTYTIRHFKGNSKMPETNDDRPRDGDMMRMRNGAGAPPPPHSGGGF